MRSHTSEETHFTLAHNPLVAFVATRDGARARAFYESILGLRVVADDQFALIFDAQGTTLHLQKVAHASPQPFTVLGWKVLDIGIAVEALRARGVSFERFAGMAQDEHGIWRAPGGALVVWFKDPDGNLLSLTQ